MVSSQKRRIFHRRIHWEADTMEMIKVFITEDESIVREGLRDIVPW